MMENFDVFREGDWINITLSSGQNALARIVHISTYFKDAIGIVVYELKNSSFTEFACSKKQYQGRLHPLLYTNINAAYHYNWEVLSHEDLSLTDRVLSKRIVGGGIMVGDDYIGPASKDDEKTIPQMLVYGMPGIYREIEKIFGTR